MSRTTQEIMTDALAHFRLVAEHATQGLERRLVLDAVCMRLSAGIEALAALEPATRDQVFGSDWRLMWGLRNRIAHGYLLVDSRIIEQTLAEDLPVIVDRIGSFLAEGS